MGKHWPSASAFTHTDTCEHRVLTPIRNYLGNYLITWVSTHGNWKSQFHLISREDKRGKTQKKELHDAQGSTCPLLLEQGLYTNLPRMYNQWNWLCANIVIYKRKHCNNLRQLLYFIKHPCKWLSFKPRNRLQLPAHKLTINILTQMCSFLN